MTKGCPRNSVKGDDIPNNSWQGHHTTNKKIQSAKRNAKNYLKKVIKDKVIAFKLPHIFDQPAFVKYNAYQRDIVTHAAVNKGSLLGLQHSTKLAY